MQIPNSYAFNGSTASATAVRKSTGSGEPNDRAAPRAAPKVEQTAKEPEPVSATVSDSRESDFAPVTAAIKSELASQDFRVRPKLETGANSNAINSYQQAANADLDDAKAQDPGLYRVDVYV
jgi:hypothetical protein